LAAVTPLERVRGSVNVEGWALYAEAEMKPYLPLDGQLVSLQHRLLRAARAFLDPLANVGRIDYARIRRFLEEEVVLSPSMSRQEAARYTFRAPGQATSYTCSACAPRRSSRCRMPSTARRSTTSSSPRACCRRS
jgi:uncharacterized protein (DUF885 family)